jgi:hypothetical protein
MNDGKDEQRVKNVTERLLRNFGCYQNSQQD